MVAFRPGWHGWPAGVSHSGHRRPRTVPAAVVTVWALTRHPHDAQFRGLRRGTGGRAGAPVQRGGELEPEVPVLRLPAAERRGVAEVREDGRHPGDMLGGNRGPAVRDGGDGRGLVGTLFIKISSPG